jgi:Zn-dependent peptidase ImmA (M78 family)
LSDAERQAMVAHELGHVWIFTHHPYLQSEALANRKAEELVSRESLQQVYEKVWELDGEATSLDAYLSTKFGIVKREDSTPQATPSLSGTK